MLLDIRALADLIGKLSDKDVPLVVDLIKRLIHSADYYIPYDDEPLTEDDSKAIEEGRKEFTLLCQKHLITKGLYGPQRKCVVI